MAFCTACGSLLEDDKKFCTSCGKAVVPATPGVSLRKVGPAPSVSLGKAEQAPAQPLISPPIEERGPTGWTPVAPSGARTIKKYWLIGGALALAACLVGGATYWGIGELSAVDHPADQAVSEPSTPPEPASPKPPAICWNDGAKVNDVSECPELTGPEAMTWVFPDSAQCRGGRDLGIAGTAVVRKTVRICDVQTAAGWTEIAYSEYASAADLKTAMGYIYGDAEPVTVGRRWKYGPQSVPTKTGIPAIKGTWVYSDGRTWAVTAGKGANAAAAAAGLEAITMRSLKELKASAPE